MIALGRNVLSGDQLIRAGQFEGWRPVLYGTGLSGSTVGIIGMGAVGREVAQRLQGFNARVIYYDRSELTAIQKIELNVESKSLAELLSISDFVVVILPINEASSHLINASTIAMMKDGAYLINTGRGSVVDEVAVINALQSGKLSGYAADVFEFEDWAVAERPRSISSELTEKDQSTVFTPHLGSAVNSGRKEIEMTAARNIIQVIKGEIPQDAVNHP